ncbi:MAG: ROK family protein [Planctomycetota bacterium]
MPLFIGLDTGGTKFMVAAADGDGRILRRVQKPTPRPLEESLALLHAMIAEVAAGERPAGMGAAIGGPLDWETGVVSPLHQPQWRNVPLKAIMRERWGCPFHVDVDTNIAALGEWHFGGDRAPRMLYITVSTGMGGGFLDNGRIMRGTGGSHPEVGHQAVDARVSHPEKVACECGVKNCLEALVSGNGIRRVYGKPAEHLDESEWAEVTWNLAQGLRNIAALCVPDLIVLGGGVAVGRGERFVRDLNGILRDHLRIVAVPRVRLSGMGYDTALMGTIAAAIHGVQ